MQVANSCYRSAVRASAAHLSCKTAGAKFQPRRNRQSRPARGWRPTYTYIHWANGKSIDFFNPRCNVGDTSSAAAATTPPDGPLFLFTLTCVYCLCTIHRNDRHISLDSIIQPLRLSNLQMRCLLRCGCHQIDFMYALQIYIYTYILCMYMCVPL